MYRLKRHDRTYVYKKQGLYGSESSVQPFYFAKVRKELNEHDHFGWFHADGRRCNPSGL
jgi:hypothetical protein